MAGLPWFGVGIQPTLTLDSKMPRLENWILDGIGVEFLQTKTLDP